MRSQQVFQYCLIDAELTAGISFSRAAETSDDPLRQASNMEQAERACQTALDFTAGSHLARAVGDKIQYKTEYLRDLLNKNRKWRMTFALEPINPPSTKPHAA